MAYPELEQFAYGFSRGELKAGPRIYIAISNVEFDQPTTEEAVMGTKPWPIARTEGEMGLGTGTLTFSSESDRAAFIADLGDGFTVRRALPSVQTRMVGPFVFFDHMGPAVFRSGSGVDVRPHPHIGLATVTYLYQGRMHHRDSLGTDQWIEPGAVNWMIAGQGITHSERTDGEAHHAVLQVLRQDAEGLDEGGAVGDPDNSLKSIT